MLLIDIDGEGDPFALAKAGAGAAAHVIRCCGVGGAIGIDFPSLPGRPERLAVDALIDTLLPPRTEERRVGKECVRTCRSRWAPDHLKKQTVKYKSINHIYF